MTAHWHAYAYTGRAYTDTEIRRETAPANYPPIEVAHWLRRPRNHVADTFACSPDGLDHALAWLEGELTRNPPVDEEHYPVLERLEGSRSSLTATRSTPTAPATQRAGDAVYGYWSKAGQYVSRALIACPREAGDPCPYGMT
ncbi:hypothetical protein [Streptomyces sp. CC208A]|uniref:hypothetical protein n=1 Tax=Streptomyces sp. CC208A TaxID=3044573 RepID=UPI0024A8E2F5|nr:hypothetical protein [Streptomyces sp. CC208A]